MAIEILDKGACKAAGVVDTLAPVVGARVQGIRSIASLAPGKIRLTLVEGIGQLEFTWEATCEVRSIGQGITANCVWIDAFTIELQSYDEAGLLTPAVVSFFFFLIEGLGTPALIVAPPPNPLQIMGQAGLVGWWPASSSVDDGTGKASSIVDASGNGLDATQATAGKRLPIIGAGGNVALGADGVSTHGLNNSALPLGAADTPTYFAVAQLDPAAPDICTAFWSWTAAAAASIVLMPARFNGGLEFAFAVGLGFGGIPPLDFLRHVFSLRFEAPNWIPRIDGVDGAPIVGAGALPALPVLQLLADDLSVNAAVNPAWQGPYFDSWITPGIVSAAQLAQLEAYAAAQYGIALP